MEEVAGGRDPRYREVPFWLPRGDHGNNQNASGTDRGRHLQREKGARSLLNPAHDIQDLQTLLILAHSCSSTNHRPIPLFGVALSPDQPQKHALAVIAHVQIRRRNRGTHPRLGSSARRQARPPQRATRRASAPHSSNYHNPRHPSTPRGARRRCALRFGGRLQVWRLPRARSQR